MLCGATPDDLLASFAFRTREIDRIVIRLDQTRADLRWVEKKAPPRWIYPSDRAMKTLGNAMRHRGQALGPVVVGSHSIDIDTKVTDIGIRAFGSFYLFPESKVENFLRPYFERAVAKDSIEAGMAVAILSLFVDECVGVRHRLKPRELTQKIFQNIEERWLRDVRRIEQMVDTEGLIVLIKDAEWSVFDPSVFWGREFFRTY